jgi:macrolide-specific efflux system membrane fusion protein
VAVSVARKWVFPIIRILIFAAIALALVKLAFFSGAISATDTTFPSAQVSEPESVVAIGTITNDVSVAATVVADAAAPMKATLAGEVRKIMVTRGQNVEASTPVLSVRSETVSDAGLPVVKTVVVTAGSAGTITSLPVIVGQLVAVGEVVGDVSPPTFSVSGSIAPELQYRLLNKPTEAKVVITGGPAPFTCTGLSISTVLSSSSDSTGASSGTGSGTTVRCAIPSGVTVFAGLAAKLVISGGVAKDVLIVPVTAVEGSAGTGTVYALKPDGSSEKHDVTLGLTDGTNVQILTGLTKDEKVLQFVPGVQKTNQVGGCSPDGSCQVQGN